MCNRSASCYKQCLVDLDLTISALPSGQLTDPNFSSSHVYFTGAVCWSVTMFVYQSCTYDAKVDATYSTDHKSASQNLLLKQPLGCLCARRCVLLRWTRKVAVLEHSRPVLLMNWNNDMVCILFGDPTALQSLATTLYLVSGNIDGLAYIVITCSFFEIFW